MLGTRLMILSAFVLASSPAPARGAPATAAIAAELSARTVQAWERYEALVSARHGEQRESAPFFALDAFGIPGWRAVATAGVALSRLDRPAPAVPDPSVPGGKIHHWAGAIFVPGTTVTAVLERLAQLAGRESLHYPDVIDSRLLAREGDRHRIFLKLRRSKVITVTYNTEHEVVYRRIGPLRATARSVSTRIAELDDAGTPQEREKPLGSDSGYLWRLNAYWRYEATGGGVLIECESVSLSRDVPVLLRPFVTGVVEGLARESLERTLGALRTVLTRS